MNHKSITNEEGFRLTLRERMEALNSGRISLAWVDNSWYSKYGWYY